MIRKEGKIKSHCVSVVLHICVCFFAVIGTVSMVPTPLTTVVVINSLSKISSSLTEVE